MSEKMTATSEKMTVAAGEGMKALTELNERLMKEMQTNSHLPFDQQVRNLMDPCLEYARNTHEKQLKLATDMFGALTLAMLKTAEQLGSDKGRIEFLNRIVEQSTGELYKSWLANFQKK